MADPVELALETGGGNGAGYGSLDRLWANESMLFTATAWPPDEWYLFSLELSGGDKARSKPPYLWWAIVKSSGSLSPQIELPASDAAPEYALLASSLTSERRGPVGEARARSSAGLILTPALARSLENVFLFCRVFFILQCNILM